MANSASFTSPTNSPCKLRTSCSSLKRSLDGDTMTFSANKTEGIAKGRLGHLNEGQPLVKIPRQDVVPFSSNPLHQSLPPTNLFNKAGPPPTPCKGRVVRRSLVHRSAPAPTRFAEFYQKTKDGEITINGIKASIVLYSPKGSFMTACTLDAEDTLVSSQKNTDLVIKFYNEEKSNFRLNRLEAFMKSSLENYKAAEDLGLEVAMIYNFDTAKQDCFFLQEKIPHEVDLSKPEQRQQLRHFFQTALENQVIFDLNPGNLRAREDGTVVLIDFVEESDDGLSDFSISPSVQLKLFVQHAIKGWATQFQQSVDQKSVAEFLEELTKGFDKLGYDLNHNQQVLQDLSFQLNRN